MTKRNLPPPPEVKGHPLAEKAWKAANNQNSNFIIFINGLPGVGKSTVAQYLQYILDRGKNYEYRCELKNWCLTQKEFINATNNNVKDVGRVITWEEPYAAGIKDGGANARDFNKHTNKQISTIFQTMRKNNHIIILTLPASTSFDKQARNMAHCLIHVQKNNGVYATARVYMRDYNPIFDTINHPFIRVVNRGKFVRVKNFYYGLPPKSWAKACNEKSDAYKNFWQREIKNYKKEKSVKEGQKDRRKRLLEAIQNTPEKYKKEKNGRQVWDIPALSQEFDYSPISIRNIIGSAT